MWFTVVASHEINHPLPHKVTLSFSPRQRAEWGRRLQIHSFNYIILKKTQELSAKSCNHLKQYGNSFVVFYSLKHLYVCVDVLVTCCVYVSLCCTNKSNNKNKKRRRKALHAYIFYLCIPSWLLCIVIIYSPSGWMFLAFCCCCFPPAVINRARHVRTFVTHFFFLLDNFLSKQRCHGLLRRSSCTDVGRIPNFVLILSACQIWKGEAGQKIIGRTSHKSECGGSRCG